MTIKAEHQATNYDWQAGFAKFNKRKQEQLRPVEPRKQRRIFGFVRYAAVLIIAVSLAAVLCYRQGRNSWMGQLADASMNVPMGSTMALRLPDGTQVNLNGGSTLSYPQSFGLKSRKVKLSGEAYFTIVHHTDQPIEILTSKMTVRDIGTKLNITNYPEDSQARIVIDEGSVELKTGNDTQTSIIVAGQEAIIDKQSGRISIVSKQYDGNAWSKGELIFHNTTVADIAKRLERTYNIDISIHHPATAIPSRGFMGCGQKDFITWIIDCLGHKLAAIRLIGICSHEFHMLPIGPIFLCCAVGTSVKRLLA